MSFFVVFLRAVTSATLTILIVLSWMVGSAQSQAHDVVRPALVHIKVTGVDKFGNPKEGVGTGFIISEEGQVLTVGHLLDGIEPDGASELIKVRVGAKGPPFPETAKIVDRLESLDLLRLKIPVESELHQPVKLGKSRLLSLGSRIYTSGFPHGIDGRWIDDGKINSKQGAAGYLWGTSMAFSGGQSGSPVYLESGEVIGVVKGALANAPNRSLFVPIDFADPLLIPLRLAALEKTLSSIPNQCRVCFRAEGTDKVCAGKTRGCSPWSNANSQTGADDDNNWSDALQLVQGSATGFASCKLKWKVECRANATAGQN